MVSKSLFVLSTSCSIPCTFSVNVFFMTLASLSLRTSSLISSSFNLKGWRRDYRIKKEILKGRQERNKGLKGGRKKPEEMKNTKEGRKKWKEGRKEGRKE